MNEEYLLKIGEVITFCNGHIYYGSPCNCQGTVSLDLEQTATDPASHVIFIGRTGVAASSDYFCPLFCLEREVEPYNYRLCCVMENTEI